MSMVTTSKIGTSGQLVGDSVARIGAADCYRVTFASPELGEAAAISAKSALHPYLASRVDTHPSRTGELEFKMAEGKVHMDVLVDRGRSVRGFAVTSFPGGKMDGTVEAILDMDFKVVLDNTNGKLPELLKKLPKPYGDARPQDEALTGISPYEAHLRKQALLN